MATPRKKTILYLHVDSQTKRWLKGLCSKEVGRVSLSTMAARIFSQAQKRDKAAHAG